MNINTKPLTRLSIFIYLVLLSISSLLIYFYQLEEAEASNGVIPISQINDISYWLIFFIWLTLSTFIFPKSIKRPSDVFILIYLLGASIWSASYWPITGYLDELKATLLMVILLLPLWLIKVVSTLSIKLIPIKELDSESKKNNIPNSLIFFLFLAFAFSYAIAGHNGDFSLDVGYFRRMTGRESFEGHFFTSYIFQMSINGFSPFLAYYSGLRKSYIYLTATMLFPVYAFWLIGLKSPFLNNTLMFVVGYMVRTQLIVSFPKWLIKTLIAAFTLALLEIYINQYSLVVDYGFRRAIMVVAQIQGYFFDSMFQMDGITYLWTGLDFGNFKSPEFLIGLKYFNDQETNANTNAFQHQIAINGFLGYCLVIIGTTIFTLICDYLTLIKKNKDGYALCFILAFLMIEQAFTTALASSGVFLCLLLTIILSNNKNPP